MQHATIAPSEAETLREAAEALQEHDRLLAAIKASHDRLRALCRRYDQSARVWATRPEHLRRACEARGLLHKDT